MDIRILGATDAEMYRNVRLEALKNHPEAFSSSFEEESQLPLDRFQKRFKEANSFTFGAFEEGQLIGTVTLVIETKIKLKHRANIVAMYVKPEMRKSGIGKRILAQAINKAKETVGIEQIYLGVGSYNEPAKKLYQSLGFETYGIEKQALKVNDKYIDEELMVLFL